jgi:methylation protein EvaC
MSFGRQPIANAYVKPGSTQAEYFYEMAVGSCPKCSLFQLIEHPTPEMVYHDHYAFYSQTSKGMMAHFEKFAHSIMDEYLSDDPFVVEIGSNDGIMLKHFAAAGMRHLGVEPSRNVAEVASRAGINTSCAFFGADTAAGYLAEYGQADAIFSSNVITHIPDLRAVGEGVAKLLKPSGVFMIEDPYLFNVLRNTSYDQIYDEHVFVFSATAVQNTFSRYGLELIDAIEQPVHGGSMRYVLGFKGHRLRSKQAQDVLDFERDHGVLDPETYRQFASRCAQKRDQIRAVLQQVKQSGARVVGYAATAKSATILNYSGVGPDLIDFIIDTTPEKQGTLSPGVHIPIRPASEFAEPYPDYAVLFAWNHRNEIMAKETGFAKAGGRWISFVPDVKIEE